jgi:hypothetical protein
MSKIYGFNKFHPLLKCIFVEHQRIVRKSREDWRRRTTPGGRTDQGK